MPEEKVELGSYFSKIMGGQTEAKISTRVVKHPMDVILIIILAFLCIVAAGSLGIFIWVIKDPKFEQLKELLDILFLRMIPVLTFALGFYVKGNTNNNS